MGAQLKANGASSARPRAAHVQNAVTGPLQAKARQPAPEGARQLAPHVEQATARPGSQRTATVQRARTSFTFDSDPGGRWSPDKRHCDLCSAAVGWGHRHHCRVCGRFVCDDCGRQRHRVSQPITKKGRSSSGTFSTERVCVDCILQYKITRATGIGPFDALKHDADAAARRSVVVAWERFAGRARYSPGQAMIYLDPTVRDPFSCYLFELTNAAQTNRLRRNPTEFTTKQAYAFHVELTEYRGTLRHQQVARAINQANPGFTVTEMFGANAARFERFQEHMDAQETVIGDSSHSGRYHTQWEEAKKRQSDQRPRRRRHSGSHEQRPSRTTGGSTRPDSGSL